MCLCKYLQFNETREIQLHVQYVVTLACYTSDIQGLRLRTLRTYDINAPRSKKYDRNSTSTGK